MIHSYEINGLPVKTGDLICTTGGAEGSIRGQLWRLIGLLIHGEVDHIAIYIGPGGRCVEAGAKLRVITFNIEGNGWDAHKMTNQRGQIIDTLYGVAYPIRLLDNPEDEDEVRISVANYCLAQVNKPYNINFFNSQTEETFYCSQLAYKAYLPHGIDLNTEKKITNIPWTESIIYPQEIWNRCQHIKPAEKQT